MSAPKSLSKNTFLNIQAAVNLAKNTGYQCWIKAYNPLFWIVSLLFIYWRDTQHYLFHHYYQHKCRISATMTRHDPPPFEYRKRLSAKSKHTLSTLAHRNNAHYSYIDMDGWQTIKTVTFIDTQLNASALQKHQQRLHDTHLQKNQSHGLKGTHTNSCSSRTHSTISFRHPLDVHHDQAKALLSLVEKQAETENKRDTHKKRSLFSIKLSMSQWKLIKKRKRHQQVESSTISAAAIGTINQEDKKLPAFNKRRSSILFLKRRASQTSTFSGSSNDSNTGSETSSSSQRKRVKRLFTSTLSSLKARP
ncbi:hypothetical protein BDF20DRAFT_834050 [Mycotypha africana]|uniref:uncharacterized protein n=1 Tax=Mycotypha africana TaxID=64632 RepID=UPI002300934B|nr:uncharacterized protein BDF20DRAFT_834050 [Mycotypha africana]KAI8984552.1 hypothetical protein BDF20DRAFT_834050 [Mycotypha africana]